MSKLRHFFTIQLLILSVATATLAVSALLSGAVAAATQQQSVVALERGYRTGYSDGYMAGYRDMTDRAARDYRNKEDYRRADRAYVTAYGELEDYRDGYQQGFEIGYDAAYERRGFDSTVPARIARRGVNNSNTNNSNTNNSSTNNSSTDDDYDANVANSSSGNSTSGNSPRVTSNGSVYIPSDTVMLVELMTNLSTEASQRGDRFQARVIEPGEYEGAIVDGRVTRVKRPGRVKGTAELQLSIEQIRLTDNRWSNLNAQVIEVVPSGNSNAGNVDEEGGVKGKDSTKDDIARVGAASGIGAIIGAIAGGGKGAAIGAAIGGAVGTTGAIATRGKDIRLPRGQQLRIRTATDTNIR